MLQLCTKKITQYISQSKNSSNSLFLCSSNQTQGRNEQFHYLFIFYLFLLTMYFNGGIRKCVRRIKNRWQMYLNKEQK